MNDPTDMDHRQEPHEQSTDGSTSGNAAAMALLALIALSVAARLTGGWDPWWHLAIGKHALEQGSTLPVEIFSFTADGVPWAHKDLVGDVLLYGAFAALGALGLVLLKAIVLFAGALSFRGVPARAAGSPWTYLIPAGLYLAAIQNRVVDRPLVFSLALFPVMLMAVERLRRQLDGDVVDRAHLLRLGGAIVALFWVWLLLHRGALAGLVIIAGAAAYVALGAILPRAGWLRSLWGKPVSGRTLAAVVALPLVAAAVGLLHPSGPAVYTSAFGVAGSEVLATYISEWQQISLGDAVAHYPVAVLGGLLAGLALMLRLVVATRGGDAARVRMWHLGVWLVFGALATTSVRWIPYFGIVSAFVAAIVAGELAERWKDRQAGASAVEIPRGAGALVALALIAGVWSTNTHEPGVGTLPDRYPDAAMAFARTHDLGPNVGNAFIFGGWVIWDGWPRFRPMLDGRNELVYAPQLVIGGIEAQRNPQAFARHDDAFDIDWVLASNIQNTSSFAFLDRDPEWMLVFWDTPSAIYVRTREHPELEPLAYRHVGRLDPAGSLAASVRATKGNPEALSAIEAELVRLARAAPTGVIPNSLLTLFYHWRGPRFYALRDKFLAHLVRVAPDHPAVQQLVSRIRGDGAR